MDTNSFYLLSNAASQNAFVDASDGGLAAGPETNTSVTEYMAGIDNSVPQSGPFGTGPFIFASSGYGDEVGLSYFYGGRYAMVTVPQGYLSGSLLESISTFHNATFASLGLTIGDYVYTLDEGQVFEIDIESSVPIDEPPVLILLAGPLCFIGL